MLREFLFSGLSNCLEKYVSRHEDIAYEAGYSTAINTFLENSELLRAMNLAMLSAIVAKAGKELEDFTARRAKRFLSNWRMRPAKAFQLGLSDGVAHLSDVVERNVAVNRRPPSRPASVTEV